MAPLPVYVGLDIGGTKLMAAAADAAGTVLRRARVPTPIPRSEGLDRLHALVEEVRLRAPVAGIGAAVGGPLDARRGVVSPLHQPEWRDVPLRAILEDRWHCPVRLDVDTNVAALGEYRLGGARPERLLYVTVSTGMGGGFVIDGEIYRGSGGVHPELAHQSIPFRCMHPERIACACGAPDCLEALVSGNGIRRVYAKPATRLTTEEWEEVAYNLGQGLRNAATLYAPDEIVLGGGVALGGGEPLLRGARAVLASRLRLVPVPALRLSRLGYDTPLLGALELARS